MNTVEGKQCIMISGWIQIKFHTKLGTLQLNKKFISLVTMQEQDQPHDLNLYYRSSFTEQMTLRSPISSCLLWTKCLIHFIAGNEHWSMFRFGLLFKLSCFCKCPGQAHVLHLSPDKNDSCALWCCTLAPVLRSGRRESWLSGCLQHSWPRLNMHRREGGKAPTNIKDAHY